MKLVRMTPGHGETLISEGNPRVGSERDRLVEAFRRQLDDGCWAGVPFASPLTGRREALLVTRFEDVPTDAERVLFWPRATGGAASRR